MRTHKGFDPLFPIFQIWLFERLQLIVEPHVSPWAYQPQLYRRRALIKPFPSIEELRGMLSNISCHGIRWNCPWWRISDMTLGLIFSHSVMLAGLREVSYCPVLRIQRQFGRPQRSLLKEHMGYVCPLGARLVERIQGAWTNRMRVLSVVAPELISPSAAYYGWLASDIGGSKEDEVHRKRKRLNQDGHDGSG